MERTEGEGGGGRWGEEGWSGGFLQIFRKIFRSPGDQRPKYFMAQYFFQKIFHGASHQF